MERTPISKEQSKSMAVGTSLHLIIYYTIALSIWGLVFSKFLLLTLIGLIIGVIISLVSAPVIAAQKSKEQAQDIMYAIGSLWGSLAMLIGIIGIITLIIRIIF